MELYFVWFMLAVVFIVIEAFTVQLTTIWFAIGALITMVVSFFTNDLTLQMLIFVGISFVTLLLALPLRKKLMKHQGGKTNVSAMVGTEVKALMDFDEVSKEGRVLSGAMDWLAYSEDVVKRGDVLIVEGIQGAKLVVKHKAQ